MDVLDFARAISMRRNSTPIAELAEQMAQSDYPRNLTILRERIPFDRILELLDTADT